MTDLYIVTNINENIKLMKTYEKNSYITVFGIYISNLQKHDKEETFDVLSNVTLGKDDIDINDPGNKDVLNLFSFFPNIKKKNWNFSTPIYNKLDRDVSNLMIILKETENVKAYLIGFSESKNIGKIDYKSIPFIESNIEPKILTSYVYYYNETFPYRIIIINRKKIINAVCEKDKKPFKNEKNIKINFFLIFIFFIFLYILINYKRY